MTEFIQVITTTDTRPRADEIARALVERRLAACVQVEGPVTSHYLWAGVQDKAEEYRLTFKVLPEQITALETWVQARHPYEVPEWVVVKVEHVAEKYLSWARANS